MSIMKKSIDPNSDLGQTHVIFLDKNHPNSNGISKAIKELKINEDQANVKKIYMIPKMSS